MSDNAEKKIYLSSPTIHGDEQDFVKQAFDTNWVAPLGPNVDAFEKEMAEYTGCGDAAALSAGTAALHLGLKLLGVGPGDIVFGPSLTFSATVNPVSYEGGTLVLIDSEKETWNMDPEALRKAYEKYPSPKACIIVHLYGTPAKMNELLAICREHGTPVLEDAAESLGSTYGGRHTGTFGDMGVYSFNGNKIITTSGGGMLVSRDSAKISKARFLSTQAREPARHYQHNEIGYNYRMSNIVAGIGRGQLLHLQEHIDAKRSIYRRYSQAFEDIPAISMNPMCPDGEANNWLSCITIDEDCPVTPDQVMDSLAAHNIESRPIWKPMHLQPVFLGCDFITALEGDEASLEPDGIRGNRPRSNSEDIFIHGLCLPSDIKNTPEDMEKIIDIVRGLF